jgi:hypothetical protein
MAEQAGEVSALEQAPAGAGAGSAGLLRVRCARGWLTIAPAVPCSSAAPPPGESTANGGERDGRTEGPVQRPPAPGADSREIAVRRARVAAEKREAGRRLRLRRSECARRRARIMREVAEARAEIQRRKEGQEREKAALAAAAKARSEAEAARARRRLAEAAAAPPPAPQTSEEAAAVWALVQQVREILMSLSA